MKIFVLKINKVIISLCIIFIITIISIICLKDNHVIAIELTSKSIISEEFDEKIRELTKGEEKVAYLTFDDGPNKVITPKILDILEKEDVKATFFVIGKNVDEYPEIVKRAYEEGHYIANHGYSHNNAKLYESNESFVQEVRKTDIAIAKAIGEEEYSSHVFRFPNGYMSPQNKGNKKNAVKLLEEMNYTYIDWNCLNNDSIKKYTNYQLIKNLKKSSKNKDTLVILMHDTKDVSNSSLVLEDSIKYLKEQGYEFENFYDLMD